MKISTKGRYALRVMIDLAEHNGGAFIPLRDIAARQEISEKYLESIISVLVKDGILTGLLLSSQRGRRTRVTTSFNTDAQRKPPRQTGVKASFAFQPVTQASSFVPYQASCYPRPAAWPGGTGST